MNLHRSERILDIDTWTNIEVSEAIGAITAPEAAVTMAEVHSSSSGTQLSEALQLLADCDRALAKQG